MMITSKQEAPSLPWRTVCPLRVQEQREPWSSQGRTFQTEGTGGEGDRRGRCRGPVGSGIRETLVVQGL